MNRWYVITGGPSSGKTTLLSELEKLGHVTIPEAARAYFDQELAKGRTIQQIRADEQKCQEEIAKLKINTEQAHPKNLLTFFDRGMHDTLAYMNYYDYYIEDWIKQAIVTANYQKVFLLEQLPVFHKDNVRTENDDFAKQISVFLDSAYSESGMVPVRVPAMPIQDRVDFILDNIEKE